MQALSDGSIRVTENGTTKILPPIFRPDGSVIEPIPSVQGSKANRQITLRRFAPVVDKEGNVLEEQVDHPNHSGLRWAKVVDGQVILTRRAREQGVVFYRDMCLGRIDGVEAAPEKWGHWLAVKKMRGRGLVPARGALSMETLYHPECIRRAEANQGGVTRLDEKAINDLLREAGEVVEADDAGASEAEAAMLKKAAKAERRAARG
jgi:hypothetical protein